MGENEQEINLGTGDTFLVDEDLQSAMEEFEEIYGEETEPQEEYAGLPQREIHLEQEEPPFYALNEVDGIGMGTPYREEKGFLELEDKKRKFMKPKILVTIAVLAVALIGGGFFTVHKIKSIKSQKEKQEKKEAMAEVKTTEAVTEALKPEYWFVEKEACVPAMAANTISLPSADLSLFETAAQQEADEVPEEERIDPWALVSLHLDSIEGSINKTSPGILEETEQLTSTYMVLVDVDTNEIIAERDCEKVVSPASMTKILTVITARDYIDETKLDDKFTITADIVNEAQASGLSAVGFLPGDKVTVRDMLYGTIVCSGADAAMGLAQYCAGSQEAFVDKMNKNVERLGLSDTAHFTNVVGKYDENLKCTMTDMATIISIVMQDDLLRDVMGTRIYTTDIKYPDLELEDGLTISNWFIRRIEDKEMNGKVLGAKTGFVNQSGFCAASYYEAKDGKHYICVTGNANSSWRAIYDHVSVYRSFTK